MKILGNRYFSGTVTSVGLYKSTLRYTKSVTHTEVNSVQFIVGLEI